jgi:hypothetical protein
VALTHDPQAPTLTLYGVLVITRGVGQFTLRREYAAPRTDVEQREVLDNVAALSRRSRTEERVGLHQLATGSVYVHNYDRVMRIVGERSPQPRRQVETRALRFTIL